MFVRQFSVRWLLVVTSACAMFFFLLAMAVNGHLWVVAIVAGITAFVVVMLVHAALFLLINLLPAQTSAGTGEKRGMPDPLDERALAARPRHTGTVS
jgi:hypothetical protein